MSFSLPGHSCTSPSPSPCPLPQQERRLEEGIVDAVHTGSSPDPRTPLFTRSSFRPVHASDVVELGVSLSTPGPSSFPSAFTSHSDYSLHKRRRTPPRLPSIPPLPTVSRRVLGQRRRRERERAAYAHLPPSPASPPPLAPPSPAPPFHVPTPLSASPPPSRISRRVLGQRRRRERERAACARSPPPPPPPPPPASPPLFRVSSPPLLHVSTPPPASPPSSTVSRRVLGQRRRRERECAARLSHQQVSVGPSADAEQPPVVARGTRSQSPTIESNETRPATAIL